MKNNESQVIIWFNC